MAALRSSLELFDKIGINALREKSERLTGYLEYLIQSLDSKKISIITPKQIYERGSQLSLQIDSKEIDIEGLFKSKNVVCDFRRPNVIRAAPCAFYNSYSDVYNFVDVLKKL